MRIMFIALTVLFFGPGSVLGQNGSRISTRADREALFDYIMAKTMEREAFSPIKNSTLGIDIRAEMERHRADVVNASTEEDLYYALVRLSNARRDRHLTVALVPGGLRLANTAGVELSNYPTGNADILHAPVQFAVDFGTPGAFSFFVSDVAAGHPAAVNLVIGDRLVAVNGRTIQAYVDAVTPYHRYSSVNGLWLKIAQWLPQRSFQFPPAFYEEALTLTFERDNERFTVVLPYESPNELTWTDAGAQRYPGFTPAWNVQTFNLHVSDRFETIALDWYGFRENLVPDMDSLISWAASTGRLGYAVIFDGTRSRGGSLGAYAMQRLSSRPFKTTFGNLRISDVTSAFVEQRVGRFVPRQQSGAVLDPGETIDDGTWLIEWLTTDVAAAIANGDDYTNNVPFKNAHAPKDSDGILQPHRRHFAGPLVGWFGPYGGSHLDQFASILVDNGLGLSLGMPAGGYSNTWEWEETLLFPISGRPVVQFMWSIGHSIRPNGEILEGNPAQMDEYLPVTRENYRRYYDLLMDRSLEYIRANR